MFKPELYKWYEFKKNGAQVIWFRHTDDINGFSVLYDRMKNKWDYEGPGNYGGVLNSPHWGEPSRLIPEEILREIISKLLEKGIDYLE